MSDKKRAAGASPLFLLFLVFLVLKLTGYIAWSWWYVTMPLWLPIVVVLAVLILVFAASLIARALD